MDEKKGTISHFAGIIRIIAAVIITMCLIVLFVRWANSRRQASNVAQKSSNQSSQTESTKSKSTISPKDQKSTPGDRQTASTGATIPSGIDDTRSSDSKTSNVPVTGLNLPAAYIIMLSATAYLVTYNQQLKRQASINQK